MKTKLAENKFKSDLGIAGRLFNRIVCLGAVILICTSAFAQNVFVSGTDARGGAIFKLSWDGRQSIYAAGLTAPLDLAFDSAGNLFVVDYDHSGIVGSAAIYKFTPNRMRTTFASGLRYPSYLAADKAGNLFVADYDRDLVYQYKSDGSRGTFASRLYHPIALAFDSVGNLFVADNSLGNIYQGSIYEYKPDGSRATFAVLDPSDRPADLAFDNMGNLFMADLGGNIYKYDLHPVLTRHGVRTTFCSVPNSAESLAFDNIGNLFVVDAGDVSGNGNAIYKFSSQGARSVFASGKVLRETFSHVAFEPMLPACCQ